MAATAKEQQLKGKGKTVLKGDYKNPESAEHIIYFPGGSISVCRTSDNQYWAHITVNKDKVDGGGVLQEKEGSIEIVRVDTMDGVKTLDHKNTDHFAVLISIK